MKQDWAFLDSLALNMILEKLIEPIDRIWFGSVCKNWHTIAKLNHHYNIQFRSNRVPMLMIPSEKRAEKRNLYSVVANRVYPLELTMLNKKKSFGSSYGWLAIVDAFDIIILVNPFKDVRPIILPWIDMKYKYSDFNIHKVTLSEDPIASPDDYAVAAIYTTRGCLAFIKAGQVSWTYTRDRHNLGFIDVTFYKGLVYAVDRWKNIVSFNLCYSSNSFERIIPNVLLQVSFDEIYSPLTYLVKSLEGELWMVRRFILREDNRNKGTKSFHVFKLELDDKDERFIRFLKLESLGDNILFVGGGDSMSMSAAYFSNYLEKDSIYYTDNYSNNERHPYPQGPFDLGIYNVKHQKFGVHCPYKSYFKGMAPPIWVVPSFE